MNLVDFENGQNPKYKFEITANNITFNDTIKVTKSYEGGLFTAGVIQYAYSYYNLHGHETPLINCSCLNYISYTSTFALQAFSSINFLRGATPSPIKSMNTWAVAAASSIVICLSVRVLGSMTVSAISCASISPTWFSNITVGTDYFLPQPNVLTGFIGPAVSECVSIAHLLPDKGDSRYRLNYDIFPILISPYICKRAISNFILIIFIHFR